MDTLAKGNSHTAHPLPIVNFNWCALTGKTKPLGGCVFIFLCGGGLCDLLREQHSWSGNCKQSFYAPRMWSRNLNAYRPYMCDLFPVVMIWLLNGWKPKKFYRTSCYPIMEFDNGAYIQYKRVKKIKENMNNSNTKYMNTRILNENILLERKENNHPYNQIRCVCVCFLA